ncbi:uncharacterized protein LOC135391838 [Ornithodoros turicata]|uniref:uncharacterized protein LOC135391838 n=1 Tax=Ornithodoros turicata TaxID=34597 RepID=UPI0031387FA1
MELFTGSAFTGVSLCLLVFVGLASSAEKPLNQGLQCDGCVAVLQELHKKLSDCQGRKKVIQHALKGLCQTENFVIYRHSPPKMVKACNFITESFGKELKDSLHTFYKKYRVNDNVKLQQEFCDETIKVCLPGQRDTDIRMATAHGGGITLEDANKKIAEQLSGHQEEPETVIESPELFHEKDEL